LELRAQPFRDHLRNQVTGELSIAMIDEWTSNAMPGCGNRGKPNCCFPPFPQPLQLLTNEHKKHRSEQRTIVYTKSLTPPRLQG
jgi:hypothetical protein